MNRLQKLFGPLMLLLPACLFILVMYALMMDLKGISTDEGFRLWIIHGGQSLVQGEPMIRTSWAQVLNANLPYAYQPLYFLIQNSLMRLLHGEGLNFFRSVNIAFLGLSLLGLLALSREWRTTPRLFLLGVFSFNAFLFMHVLQIREYVAGVAFYIWSTWIVLQLDRRTLDHPGRDVAWFAGYGVVLTTGFYLQSWVVFPAIGQFLFLLLQRRARWGRFLGLLALTSVIVLCATVPYLLSHQQKMNVGLWASESESVQSHLSHGFHLVLAGHLSGQARFTDFLYYFWWIMLAVGSFLFLWDRTSAPTPDVAAESRRQSLLMALCIAVSLAFQLCYTLFVENLAIWPRYFVIHYFFLIWLIALSFRYFWELRTLCAARWARYTATLTTGVMGVVMVTSAVYQVRSFRADPYLDTSQNHVSNWRNVAATLARIIRPGDVVLTSDFINQATLTFTKPMTNRVMVLAELDGSVPPTASRVVYVEPAALRSQRDELAVRLEAQGYLAPVETRIYALDGVNVTNDWRILVFPKH